MKFLIALLFCALFAWRIEAKPLEERLELVEDDMYLTKEQKEVYNQLINGRARRAAVKGETKLWPNGIVYYTFDGGLNEAGKNRSKDAMKHWTDNTCLTFVERTNQRGYVTFINDNVDDRCSSRVGFRNTPNRTIRIGASNSLCSLGSVIHEIGHAIGFYHEHVRPDRDDYITVNETNMKDTDRARRQFAKKTVDQVDSRGEGYDYGSIMHYSRTQASRNRQPVLVPKAPHENVEFGQRVGLSAGDIAQARLMYKCNVQGDSELDYVPSADDNGGPDEIEE